MDAELPVVFLMGPTASGKTGIAVRLCETMPVELVSVDSALVYRGMDIGTAKPDTGLLARAPHRLIDIRDPADPYSAADFCVDATCAIREIHAAGKLPVLVGGTMLYFRALKHGLADLPDANPEIRGRILALAEQQGWPAVHQRLAEVDPAAAARLKPTDAQRLQRALEVFEVTGHRMSELWEKPQQRPGLPNPCLELGLIPEHRASLHAAIEARFDQMLEQGLEAEVQGLMSDPSLHPGLPSMRAVGYRQMWEYLANGKTDFSGMRMRSIAATRQLAKRQLTWLRGWQNLQTVPAGQSDSFARVAGHVQRFLSEAWPAHAGASI